MCVCVCVCVRACVRACARLCVNIPCLYPNYRFNNLNERYVLVPLETKSHLQRVFLDCASVAAALDVP